MLTIVYYINNKINVPILIVYELINNNDLNILL